MKNRRTRVAVLVLVMAAVGFIAACRTENGRTETSRTKTDRTGTTAASAALRDSPATVLTGATIVDGTGKTAEGLDTVLIRDGLIAAVVMGLPAGLPEGTAVIDCTGLFILPGFINAHVHDAYDPIQLARWAQAGVTTVRDLGPRVVDFLERRDLYAADPTLAAIVSGTPILHVQDGYGWDVPPIRDADDARGQVADFIDHGADIIKFALEAELPPGKRYAVMPEEVAAALVSEAHRRGKRVSVHVSRDEYALEAIRLGADDLAHMVVGPLSKVTIEEAAKRGVIWIPTLELWKGVGWGLAALLNLEALLEAGVTIALGTDYAGYYINFDKDFPLREVLALQEAGMAAEEIIAAGTMNAAVACGLGATHGRILSGYVADLVAVARDPRLDLKALSEPKLVFHYGVMIRGPAEQR